MEDCGAITRTTASYHRTMLWYNISMPRYTYIDRLRWKDQYLSGDGYKVIAERQGCSINTIVAALSSLNVESRPPGTPEITRGSRLGWGRRTSSAGYIIWEAWVPKQSRHRFSNKRQIRFFEHRLVMEILLGRELTSSESVHHKNGDRTDNSPENLELRTRYHGDGLTHCPHCKEPITPVIRESVPHESIQDILRKKERMIWSND
jgi:hypothetical protein